MKNLTFFVLFIVVSCASRNVNTAFYPGPHSIVYKTKADYFKNVPVVLDDEKKMIFTYPAKEDLKLGNDFQYPTRLKGDWLLDNRGINKNVAFLKLTYEEYYNLKEIPAPDELYNLIIDKDPLTQMCDCGLKKVFKNEKKQLNNLIKKRKLKDKCKNLLL